MLYEKTMSIVNSIPINRSTTLGVDLEPLFGLSETGINEPLSMPFEETSIEKGSDNIPRVPLPPIPLPPIEFTVNYPDLMSGTHWDEYELDTLKTSVEKAVASGRNPCWKSIAQAVGRSYSSCRCKAVSLGFWDVRTSWSDKEVETLKTSIEKAVGSGRNPCWKSIAQTVGRSKTGCRNTAVKLGFWDANIDRRKDYWSDKEVETLKTSIEKATGLGRNPCWTSIAQTLGRSYNGCRIKAVSLGFWDVRTSWSDKKVETLKTSIEKAVASGRNPCWKSIAQAVGRSYSSCRSKAVNLGFWDVKKERKRISWTDKEVETLKTSIEKVVASGRNPCWKSIAQTVGRSYSSCRSKAVSLGFWKDYWPAKR